MGLAIKIKKADDGNLCAVGNNMALFEFRYEPEVGKWLFFIGHGIRKEWDGRAFPWITFRELCKSVAFLFHDEPIWADWAVTIVSGKSYIK